MKIVLASTSAIKLDACRRAFPDAVIETVKAPSGVSEQPIGDETLRGAFNRITAARLAVPDADVYVSIENGLFVENGEHIDCAVVVMAKGDETITAFSDGVPFPADAVAETASRGFAEWTVGKVMAEMGLVRQHDDPHLDLSGKPRAAYIDDAMRGARAKLGL